MKNIKKSIYAGVLISAIGCSYTYANIEVTNNNKNQINNLTHYNYKQLYINDIFEIEQKIDDENNEFFKSNIKYPYLKIKDNYIKKDDATNKNIEKINNEILNTVTKFKDEIKIASNNYKESYEKNSDKNQYIKYQYESVSDYKITYNKKNILSIPLTMYEFTGGAHGLTNIKHFNYNLITGQEIKLKDLFKVNSNYKEIINKYISDDISKNPNVYFLGEDGFKGIKDDQNFYITEEGIVIYFSLYDIAPYSTGIPMFTITWDDIIDYLENPNIIK